MEEKSYFTILFRRPVWRLQFYVREHNGWFAASFRVFSVHQGLVFLARLEDGKSELGLVALCGEHRLSVFGFVAKRCHTGSCERNVYDF